MTVREMFERVATHLLAQNKRAYAAGQARCMYRAEVDGVRLSCAAGCLVPDELYDPEMEGCTVSALELHDGMWSSDTDPSVIDPRRTRRVALARALNASGVPGTERHQAVLAYLQTLHDRDDVAEWPASLQRLRDSLTSEDDR